MIRTIRLLLTLGILISFQQIQAQYQTGLVLPSNWKTLNKQIHFANSVTLPATFDWRQIAPGGLTPIQNQGQCGSCWAFASAANFADVMKIRENQTFNISQQFLLSCNTQGFSCAGGWWAHDMHKQFGWVDSSDYPYKAADTQCRSGLKYHDKLKDWAYVGSRSDVPPVAAMKQAIMVYGPLTVGVAASSSFQSYRSGVFSRNDSSGVNHAVNIVGWDDNTQSWIMRNSWGKNWGESGFMRIKYGVNAIGTAASFLQYEPKCQNQAYVDAGGDLSIKSGESIQIGGIPMSDANYRWYSSDGQSIPDSPNPSVSPKQDTTYTMVVTTSCGASAASMKVSVLP